VNRFKTEFLKNKQKYLRDHIFEALQQAIYNGQLKSGERLTEKKIAEELGVSRTPVREALYRLASSGLIKMIPHRGFIVSRWSLKEIEDVLELRSVLEVFAVKLAIDHIQSKDIVEFKKLIKQMEEAVSNKDNIKTSSLNTLFHDKIIFLSNNTALLEAIEPIKSKIYHFRIISIYSDHRLEESFNEHKEILDAIINKDTTLAQKLVEQHINKVGLTIKQKIKNEQEWEKIQSQFLAQ
jgi:DNA-binding GntR family transcriptional regulator